MLGLEYVRRRYLRQAGSGTDSDTKCRVSGEVMAKLPAREKLSNRKKASPLMFQAF